jgi:hypothetical protein
MDETACDAAFFNMKNSRDPTSARSAAFGVIGMSKLVETLLRQDPDAQDIHVARLVMSSFCWADSTRTFLNRRVFSSPAHMSLP